jgi:hypothetical protein
LIDFSCTPIRQLYKFIIKLHFYCNTWGKKVSKVLHSFVLIKTPLRVISLAFADTGLAHLGLSQGCQIFLYTVYQTQGKILQMATKLPNRNKYTTFSIPKLSKNTQTGIFGMKIYVPSGNPGPFIRRNFER